ncbi:hypothetical protein ACTFIR_011856 [Dictyostelium discoideum]
MHSTSIGVNGSNVWSFNGLIITPDSIKGGPVLNSKEQRKGVLSILELTSLDDIVDTFYDKRIIGEKSGDFLNTKRNSWPVVHNYRQQNKVTVRDDHPFTQVTVL